jgi:hypothetical protein
MWATVAHAMMATQTVSIHMRIIQALIIELQHGSKELDINNNNEKVKIIPKCLACSTRS